MEEQGRPAAVREEVPVEERRYPPPEAPRTSGLAIVSLATGIGAWFIIPLLGAIVAVVTGYLALQEIRQSRGRLTGSGLATAGIALGAVQLALILLGAIIIAVIFS